MRRTKILIAVWLPLLWLAATAYSSADGRDGSDGLSHRTSFSSAAGGGHHDAARDFYAPTHALRHLNRRAGMSADSDGKSLPVIDSASALAGLKHSPILFSVVEAPAELLRCWQFYSRTAPEPRAPSPVS